MEIGHAAKPVRQDRISKLDDPILGHVLSFLPSKQAARAAALSSRWRDAFAGVHTVSLEEPEGGIPTYHRVLRRGSYDDSSDSDEDERLDPPSRFFAAITAAIVGRHRSPAATPPLRALRVALQDYKYGDSVAVDQWVSYALKQAGPELELDLRFRGLPIYCSRDKGTEINVDPFSPYAIEVPGGGCAAAAITALYTTTSGIFSCSALRTLRIGPCKLSPPSTISLPSLEELLLTRVSDGEEVVQRIISACPRLADLTLESCDTVTTLCLFGTLLRRLALRCCHNLSRVTLEVSELGAFEYRGAVPEMPFLATLDATCCIPLASCTVDICGGEVSSTDELARLTKFLHHFESAKHLRLRSKRLCPDIGRDNDGDCTAMVGTTRRILRHALNLEVISFVFETGTWNDIEDDGPLPHGHYNCRDEELLDAHRLRYNRYNVLNAPCGSAVIPCLVNRVREINLVHYQGGRAQRTLAKFLLCNAPVMDELWCQFAEGPLWMQTELVREMKGWVMNQKANTVFR
ncbi:unnamed protein product [Alopecurus aequalis]